jgi:hypothetical protein
MTKNNLKLLLAADRVLDRWRDINNALCAQSFKDTSEIHLGRLIQSLEGPMSNLREVYLAITEDV